MEPLEIFFPIVAIDWLIVVAGALVVIQPSQKARRAARQRGLKWALALAGAFIGLASAWSIG